MWNPYKVAYSVLSWTGVSIFNVPTIFKLFPSLGKLELWQDLQFMWVGIIIAGLFGYFYAEIDAAEQDAALAAQDAKAPET